MNTVLQLFSSFLCIMPSFQPSQPQTVLDYYRLLPDKYFEVDRGQRINWMLDPKRGAIIDVKNGYLYAAGDGAQADVYVCIFKRPDGTRLIGVKTYPGDTDEYTYLIFYFYEHEKWKDVTSKVLPVKVNKELKYEMPRSGTAIKVTNKQGRKLFEFVWTGEVFKLQKNATIKQGRA